MKTKLLLLAIFLTGIHSFAQTTVNYPQQLTNYTTFIDAGIGCGFFDNSTDEFGMYAHDTGAKRVAAWRNFTQDGLPGGTASTMSVGDSFTISLYCLQAKGQIGIALLSSPASTGTWADRHNNYAVQLNLNGPNYSGWSPWEIVSSGGTITSTNNIWGNGEFTFKFTLISTTEMDIVITKGGTPTTFNNITINAQNITGYSVYLEDDDITNGDGDHKDIYWKPTTEYRYATTLSNNDYLMRFFSLNLIENTIQIEGLEYNQKFKLDVYDLNGKLVKKMNEKSDLTIKELATAVYILKFTVKDKGSLSKKVIKK